MKKIIFTLAAVFSLTAIATAQNNFLPDEPILESVSIDPVSGEVTLNWQPLTPAVSQHATDGFVVYWHKPAPNAANYEIARIDDPTATSYSFLPEDVTTTPPMPDPRTTSVAFAVASFNNATGRTSTRSDEDYCTALSLKYDSCRSEIILSWHPYMGWHDNRPPYKALKEYRLMELDENGQNPKQVQVISDQDTSIVLTNIKENSYYSYYIEAVADGYSSTSYRVEKATTMPEPASFVKFLGTSYNDLGQVEIICELDPDDQTRKFEFLGSANPDNSFVPLKYFEFTENRVTIVDDAPARNQSFFYQLGAWHVCQNRFVAESNIATGLWLSNLPESDVLNNLSWHSYQNWSSPSITKLHRQIGTEPEQVIYETSEVGPITYLDDITGILITGDICYWVTAEPTVPTSPEESGISNKVCIQPESDIFIPQAFTPNGDGQNDIFRPFFSYPPQEFVMYIYDRSGRLLFSSQSENDGWDGTFKGSKLASEGVYVYYLRYLTAKGKTVEKRGPFSLIVP